MLQLLEHRVGNAIGEIIAWQKQNGYPIDASRRRAGYHVRGAGSDRSRTGKCCGSVSMFSKGGGQMHHSLFVLRPIKGYPFFASQFGNALIKAGNFAVTEDTPNAFDKAALAAVAFNELASQEPGESLASG